ncbi:MULTISPECIES: hypothetical protein [unclassified Janthinobacterium]|uniref:hypothetical protein n=1 Tax=unclassified Janthinobacterium TaxID=2610881 RepID=UPI000349157A|nr:MULTISPECIES: hypothetical protein [unclassified Janthinobacterium]MEC5161356.1 hypothetical protein [Janthinobacterium sp. CG_S6]
MLALDIAWLTHIPAGMQIPKQGERRDRELQPTLARHGYRLKDMTEQFDAWICPDVYLINRIRRMLGNVLDEVGFSPKDRVRLTIEDDLITLTHERSGLPASSGSRSAQN